MNNEQDQPVSGNWEQLQELVLDELFWLYRPKGYGELACRFCGHVGGLEHESDCRFVEVQRLLSSPPQPVSAEADETKWSRQLQQQTKKGNHYMRYRIQELGTQAFTNQIGEAVGTSMSKAEHIVLASGVGRFDASVTENSASARLDQTLDGDVLDSGVDEQSIGRVVVKFSGNRTAVVHFSVRVDGEKVTAKIVAGRKSGETIKTVNVPVWSRTHLAGKA